MSQNRSIYVVIPVLERRFLIYVPSSVNSSFTTLLMYEMCAAAMVVRKLDSVSDTDLGRCERGNHALASDDDVVA